MCEGYTVLQDTECVWHVIGSRNDILRVIHRSDTQHTTLESGKE
jgi:hypothetical protein